VHWLGEMQTIHWENFKKYSLSLEKKPKTEFMQCTFFPGGEKLILAMGGGLGTMSTAKLRPCSYHFIS
jgi:hypothetical protein